MIIFSTQHITTHAYKHSQVGIMKYIICVERVLVSARIEL